MFDVLHRGQDNVLQKQRIKFFWTLFIGIFFWQWLPELFGGAASNEGLGLFSIWLGLNCRATLECCAFIGVYANNVWHAQNFSFLGQ
ncbi:hypothetical protein MPER_03545, partial [Moniliophthora perniciosa FA553]